MNPLLISGFGTAINVDKRRLIVANRLDNLRLEFYPHQISYDSIIIDGHTGNVSFEALRWMAKHDISFTMLNWNGNLLSTALPIGSVSSKLKMSQYQAYLDENKRHKIARAIVDEKIGQSLNLLKELSVHYPDIDFEGTAKSFTERFYKKNLESIESIMVYEGQVAEVYWDCLSTVFNKLYPEFNFKRRNNSLNSHNRNASDGINALLNYGYAILEAEIRKDLNSIGFDPSISFLHELSYSRSSLVYDIQELYRWIVDLSVMQLLEDKALSMSNFVVTENYNIRLSESAAKMLIGKIRLNFNSKALFKGRYCTYQTILYQNVQIFANYILGKSRELRFDIPEFEIHREDDIELRNKLLNMTPQERRKLHINKSTLWYMQKHIKERKRIKVYNKVMEKL